MSYHDHYVQRIHTGLVCVHSWAETTQARQAWHYGPERAALIAAGKDEQTNADIEAWNNLGGSRPALRVVRR